MKTYLLTPSDTLFFRDGRPMEGSLAGHGAFWCPPQVLAHAFRAALHRSSLQGTTHAVGKDGVEQKFGSLRTIGPFPVDAQGRWHFPCPADLFSDDESGLVRIGWKPFPSPGCNSLPRPLSHVLGATCPPSKSASPGRWLRAEAWEAYFRGDALARDAFAQDSEIGDAECSVGIGLDRETGAQDGERIYSAQSLRLKNGWRMGAAASAEDPALGEDLLERLFPSDERIIVGGQQRVCTVEAANGEIPVPRWNGDFPNGLLKWILLTPAIYTETLPSPEKNVARHPGGWLPSWIDCETGQVLLREPVARNDGESRRKWRARMANAPLFKAWLIAAKIGPALPVSGWSMSRGAKPTQLAVPAGSIYYFQCADSHAAKRLAAALSYPNAHSQIWGEKGFGVGVCAPFETLRRRDALI